MTEEDTMFDPTMKKRKKKKAPFNPDAALLADEPEAKEPEVVVESIEKEQVSKQDTEKPLDSDLDDFASMKKKKKKKRTPLDMEELGESLPETNNKAVEPDNEITDVTVAIPKEADDIDMDIGFSTKKKKKKKKITFDEDSIEPAENEDEDDGTIFSSGGADKSQWDGSDRDYTYEELLTLVFDEMRKKNPDMLAGEKKRFVMKPPQVVRVGTKKSSFTNFAEVCKALHRTPKHLLSFLLVELGTSGSVDGSNQLIIKGRFQQKQLESVLRRYIKEYVTCHTCRSPDTIIQKDTRLNFMQCESCGARCSVANIKSGFQAVTGKRAAIRAKTT